MWSFNFYLAILLFTKESKIEPTIKLNRNIYMSFPSRLPFGWAMRAFISGLKGGES